MNTPLHTAIDNGQIQIAELLIIKHNTPIDAKNKVYI